MAMNRNVGGTERIVRLGSGAVLLLGGIAGYAGALRLAVGPFPQALTAVVLVAFGLILLATGGLQYCPINQLLGRDSCPMR
jgi:hypothetical protein